MPVYRYRAASPQGKVHTGVMSVVGENALEAALAQSGLELIDGQSLSRRAPLTLSQGGRRVRREKAALFCRQMEDLLGAGLALQDALPLIAETFPPGPFQDKLTDVRRNLEEGQSLSESFAPPAPFFDPVFMAFLRAGQESGQLAATFGLLARHIEKEQALADKRAKALRYPLFLLVIALSVATFMMEIVIPEVVSFLSTLGGNLPFATRLLIGASRTVAALWLPALSGIALLGVGLRILRAPFPKLAQATDRTLLRLPFYGPAAHAAAMARWLRALSLLLQNDLTFPEALNAARDALGNQDLALKAEAAHDAILTGLPVSEALMPLLDPLDVHALRMAEKSGSLPRVLNRMAQSSEEKADRASERFWGFFEPALTLWVGALLAWIVLAVLGPVYGNLGVIGGGLS